jgi:hypothetical protein
MNLAFPRILVKAEMNTAFPRIMERAEINLFFPLILERAEVISHVFRGTRNQGSLC